MAFSTDAGSDARMSQPTDRKSPMTAPVSGVTSSRMAILSRVPSTRTRRRWSSHRWSNEWPWSRRSTFAMVHVSPYRSAAAAPSSVRASAASRSADHARVPASSSGTVTPSIGPS